VRLDEEVAQQPVDGLGRVANLVIAPRAAGQFQPVQLAFFGQWLVKLALSAQHRQQRIAAQLLVIVQVFVAERQSIDALRQHPGEWMRDQQRRAAIAKTAPSHPSRLILRSTARSSNEPPSVDT